MNAIATVISVFVGVVLASYVFVALFLGWVTRKNIVDVPNHRSSHDVPTPKGGGVAIATLTLIGFFVVSMLFTGDLSLRAVLTYTACASLIAAVSWFDDLRELSAKARFAAHAVGGIFAIVSIGHFDTIMLPLFGEVTFGWLGIPITFLWIVGLTNLYNFMDGIDGLSGMQAVVAAFGWVIVGVNAGEALIQYLALFVAASSVGFLWHNWHPAKIFMGDVGSAFLGYTFAVLPLMFFNLTGSSIALPLGIFFVFAFVFDGGITILRRLRNGENIFEAHRTHLYQRLNISGYDHDQVTGAYLLLAFVGLAAGVTFQVIPEQVVSLLTVLLMLACAGLWYFVSWREAVAGAQHAPSPEPTADLIMAELSGPNGVWPRNRYLFLFDLLCLAVVPLIALVLRLDTFPIDQTYWQPIMAYTIVAMAVRVIIFYTMGLYQHYWRYASIDELAQIIVVTVVATLVVTLIYLPVRVFVGLPLPFPRSLPIIDGVLMLIALGGSRYAIRFMFHRQNIQRGNQAQQVLVMGAGNAGTMIVREIQNNPRLGMFIVGFLDDDTGKHGMKIHGVPVLGGRNDIARVAARHRVNQLIIAMPSVGGKIIRDITSLSERAGIDTKIVPSMHELLAGTVKLNQLRDVVIEDLLRRHSVTTDQAAVQSLVQGKRILITGGGGSIGSELCRQIWRCGPSQMVLLGHGENSIFDIHNELSRLSLDSDTIVSAVIADVRFPDRIQSIFEQFKPEIVFHAAAHKHVPLMESNPVEAITNNVFGTQNVLNAALASGVDRFVMISTDKAVNPTSIMGASKRIAELLVHRAAKASEKPFVAVRFGNVLGSRGSVVWTFKKQIAMGGPVTVTHPDMERFFMTIPEASQLVLQAAVLGQGEQVFVLDMGEPVKISDMARDMIELSGLQVGSDVEIVYSGLRPGEKLYEELFIPGELYERTENEKIFLAENAASFVTETLDEQLAELRTAVSSESKQAIMIAISHIVPEFRPPEWEQASAESKAAVPNKDKAQRRVKLKKKLI